MALRLSSSSRPLLGFSKSPFRLSISGSQFSTAFRRGALRPNTLLPPEDGDPRDSTTADDSPQRKSRNEAKREARRAVKWGMELAKFNNSQIKRVLKVASLDEDVFDALMLVKRLGPDVREGKRRQFNYIGRLLREAQSELMEALIQASKDGDNSRLHALSGGVSVSIEEDEELEDTTYEGKEEEGEEEGDGSDNHIEVAARWLDGLIYKDQSITNEVYSVHNVDFDRQRLFNALHPKHGYFRQHISRQAYEELRKLVRRVQSVQQSSLDEESGSKDDSMLTKAKKPLIRFLRSLAKQSLAE